MLVGSKELSTDISCHDTLILLLLGNYSDRTPSVSFHMRRVSLLVKIFRFLVHMYGIRMLSNSAEQLAHQYLHRRPL